jgi:hypothetical protein
MCGSCRWARGWVESLRKKKKPALESTEVLPKPVCLSKINSRINSLARIRVSVVSASILLLRMKLTPNICYLCPLPSFVPHVLRLSATDNVTGSRYDRHPDLELHPPPGFRHFHNFTLETINTTSTRLIEPSLCELDSKHGVHQSRVLEARSPSSG